MNQETLNMILTLVVVPLATTLVGYLIAYISKKSKEIQDNINSEKVREYVYLAEKLVCQSVQKVYQTYVDTLKADGTFDAEKAEIAFAKAKMEILKLLTDSAKEAIVMVYGDLNAWLETQIEYNVKISKTA